MSDVSQDVRELAAPAMAAAAEFRSGPCPGQFEHGPFFVLVTVQRGGWTGYYPCHPDASTSGARCEHYGDSWRTHEALRPETRVYRAGEEISR